jgi:hypothetical protein
MVRRLLFAYRDASTQTRGVLVLLGFFVSHLIGQGSGRVCLTSVALAAVSGASSSFGSQASFEFVPEDFGAVGDGLHDNSAAFQAAVSAAQKQQSFAVIHLSSGETYKVCHPIAIDYRGQGQILRQGISFQGVGSKVFLCRPTGSFFAINILLDGLPEQDTKVLFDGIWFYTDNANRPNGIYIRYACFVTIRNCVFYQFQGGLIEGKPMLFAGPCRFCSVDGTTLQGTDLSFPTGAIDPSFHASFLHVVTSPAKADRVVIEKGRIEDN